MPGDETDAARQPALGRQPSAMHLSADTVLVDGVLVPLRFVRHPRARRYVLRLSADGDAVVTMPRRGSRLGARQFADAHGAWLARERRALMAEASRARPLTLGDTVLIAGRPHAILRADDRANALRIASAVVPLRDANVHETVRRWLRAIARTTLVDRLAQLAALHGLTVAGVSIRDQRTRWGSCSRDGRISLNWRLVQMPDAVRDYVLLHELMHLRVRNHSRRFWLEVNGVCPDHAEARRWLRDQACGLL